MTLKKLVLYIVLTLLFVSFVWWVVYSLAPSELQPTLLRLGAVVLLIAAAITAVVQLVFLLPTVHGAIFYPSSDEEIKHILSLAKVKSGERAVDIGSGDGRIVTALAAAGADAHGYEINFFLVWWSRWRARLLPKEQRGTHHWASLWLVNFADYDVVTIFGMTYIMKDLERKLQRELKPGARVICNSFPFPNWPVARKIGRVYLYIQK